MAGSAPGDCDAYAPGRLGGTQGGQLPSREVPCLSHAASQRGSQDQRVFGKSGLYSVVSVQFQTERQTPGDAGKHSEGVAQCLLL